ncbi:MAG: dihydroorotate dehydrogenase electron transfer subunit [Melioribacteraceae bacterium]|nr:dihydroorotate dehydrogenase electron transfer subunit [Melioribacteraceae bacterium]MCF8264262.1 dihydroorotate dehydrogenase electron transfer subunit [Melioribacteraceae bacterium]MCF8413394.1 dihydroorotate dehydrogenase electron transfer subunit [Melioribacteraceae bacterium]MCF8431762.1 dihydroorotate dehydrogenase electron transfer subunit [Melioribacteraceae bacterium]
MFIENAPVDSVSEIQPGIHLLKVYSPSIAKNSRPGQFCNIKVSETKFPLLRRPFSICNVDGDFIYFMFNVYGEGTKLLSIKKKNETIDVLGPLGNGFDLDGNYKQAIIVAGGLGSAPFAYVTKSFINKNVISFIGGRSKKDVITYGLLNIKSVTEDGSLGMKGNVIDLLKNNISEIDIDNSRIFACGPNAMLRALKSFAMENSIECYASTECAMACGFGICQGCPIENADTDGYKLVCKDGPVFNVKDVVI